MNIERFTAHRDQLFGIAYRMLGSVADAEDIVQEVYLRWRTQSDAEIASPKAWLVAATTRLCIDRLRSAQRRREEYVGVWLPEPLLETGHDPREHSTMADSLSMAFMLLLDTLSPTERAVFLLREAFDYDYAEISRIVGKPEPACRQIVSRAKRSLATQPSPSARVPAKVEHLVQQFMAATETGKLPDLLALLSDNVVLYTDGGGKARSALRPIRTADRVSRFFVGVRRFALPEPSTQMIRLNGGCGAVIRTAGRVDRVVSFAFEGDRIRAIYIVRNPDKLRRVAAQLEGSN